VVVVGRPRRLEEATRDEELLSRVSRHNRNNAGHKRGEKRNVTPHDPKLTLGGTSKNTSSIFSLVDGFFRGYDRATNRKHTFVIR